MNDPVQLDETDLVLLQQLQRDARLSQQGRLPHRGHRAAVVYIGPQIAAVVDARQHPLGFRAKMAQADARAIGRRAVQMIATAAQAG